MSDLTDRLRVDGSSRNDLLPHEAAARIDHLEATLAKVREQAEHYARSGTDHLGEDVADDFLAILEGSDQ